MRSFMQTLAFCRPTLAALLFVLWALPAWAQNTAAESWLSDAATSPEQLMYGLITGVLLTAATYLFFIWLAIRDRSQIFLILILVALAANLALSADVVLASLGISSTSVTLFVQNAAMLLFLGGCCFFTVSFLEVDNFSAPLAGLLKVAAGALALVFMMLSFNARFTAEHMPLVSLAVFGLCLLAGVAALMARVPGAHTHILAFGLLTVGSLGAPLEIIGLVGARFFGVDIFFFASALAALVFAVGIAGQFARRQEEKERQLTVSNERFTLAALGSNEGLFDWNLEEKTIFFAERMKKILGRDLDASADGINQWMETVVSTQRQRIQKTINDFLAGDAVTIGFEYQIARPDGARRWLYTSGVALRDARTGKVRRLVGSTGDISERKQAEVALKESEARFRSITEAHPVPVAIITLNDSKMLYGSPGVEILLGIPLSELVGYPCDIYFTDHGAHQRLLTDLVSTGHVDAYEVGMNHFDGRVIPVAISARLIDYQGQHAAVIGMTDLTERKHAEDEIASQRRALEQSEKLAALGSLLAGVAHELNNPLSVVVGQSTLLLESSPDVKTQTRADKIKKAAERCTRIVRNFLALARRKDPERKSVDLNGVINTAFELILPQLKNDNVEAKLELDVQLPLVSADADQLNQILTNLVLNAKQALVDRPEPRLIIVKTISQPATGTVQLRVADNGPGVPLEIRARIFEPFFTTKKEGRGTGIGLSLSLGLAEAHGGAITYDDTPGGGATFVLTLPISVGETIVEAEKPATPTEKLSPKRILLVDDEPDVMQILADLLGNDGHAIQQANNGEEALAALAAAESGGQFDMIISDLRMPVMDGPTFYRTLRERYSHYINRIMFVTGDTLSPHVRAFLEEFPVIVIDKPYMPDDVRNAMARVLRIAEGTKKG
jgi:PAS domain S-box-containing protein